MFSVSVEAMARVRVFTSALALLLVCLAGSASASPLIQLSGAAGCVRVGGAGGCTDSGSLSVPGGLVVTDNTVYVTTRVAGSNQGAGVVLFDRNASTGALTRRPGPAGCIAETGDNTSTGCMDGHALAFDGNLGPASMAISPDGTKLYVASPGTDAVAVLLRNTATGNLSQATDATGCISQTGAGTCNDGRGLVDMSRVAVSPDGTSVYASGNGVGGQSNPGGVAWMKVGATGLTQETNQSACFQQVTDAECTGFPSAGMYQGGTGIQVSPDGEHVYAASFTSSSIITFDRTPGSGALTQTGCLRGTANANCTTTPELFAEVSGLRFANGTQLWATVRNKDNGFNTGRFQRFNRDPATGTLTLGDGCVSATALSDSCAKSNYLFTANDIVFTPDGKTAVTTSHLRRTLHSFNRTADGRLENVTNPLGCLTALSDANCTSLRGVDNAFAVEVSPDGRFVYGVGQAGFEAQTDGLTAFRRDTGAPACPDQTVSVPAGATIRINLTCTEPDQEPLTRTLVEPPAFGVLSTINQETATIDYAPGGQSGSPRLKFKATANGVDSPVATVTINIQGGTTPPPGGGTPPPGTGPGGATPPEKLTPPIRSSFTVFKRYTRVRRLQIVDIPSGAKVQILCKGKGCPFKSRPFKPAKGRVDATKAFRKAKLRKGAKLEVRITKPGAIGKSVTYAFNGKTVPRGQGRCLPVGSTKPVKC